jgi:hypothetical protein
MSKISLSPIVLRLRFAGVAALALAASGLPLPASADLILQTNLVSDIPGLAIITDPNLRNPWGVSRTATSPFWISDQGTNLTNLWSVIGPTTVTKVTAVNPPTGNIAIPTLGAGPAQGPTGQVSNQNPSPSSFPVGNGGGTAVPRTSSLGT